MNDHKNDNHQHHQGCGCSAPHPLFGLAIAAAIVAFLAVLAMVLT